MKKGPRKRRLAAAAVGLGVLALAATTGVAFSAWVDKGAAIFMTYAETGLAWCF